MNKIFRVDSNIFSAGVCATLKYTVSVAFMLANMVAPYLPVSYRYPFALYKSYMYAVGTPHASHRGSLGMADRLHQGI